MTAQKAAVPPTTSPPLRTFLARRFASKGPLVSWFVFEPLGGALAYLFARTPLSPSAVTLIGGVAGIAGAAVLGTAADWGDVAVAAVLLLLAYALDCADGQLARATGRTSDRGAWLDVTVDAVVTAFLVASLSYALSVDGPTPWGFLIAGAYGASRVASLFTWTTVRSTKEDSLRLGGVGGLIKAAYGAAVDTPLVYAMLCATRLFPVLFRTVILAVAAMTVVRMLIASHRHFSAAVLDDAG